MSGKKINTLTTGSISGSELIFLGDIATGALKQTSYNAFKDFVQQQTLPTQIPFTASVPLNRSLTVMTASLTSSITLYPNTASAAKFGACQITLNGDGSHFPSFGYPFIRLSTSGYYNSASNGVNYIYSYFDGANFPYEIASATTAATSSSDPILALSNLIRYYDTIASTIVLTGSYVSSVSDLSPLALPANNPSTASAGIWNGSKTGIDFNQSNWLNISSPTITTTAGASIVCVMDNSNPGGGSHSDAGIILCDSSGTPELCVRSGSIYNGVFSDPSQTKFTSVGPWTGAQKAVFVITYNSSRGMNVYFNGTSSYSTTMGGSGTSATFPRWGALDPGNSECPVGTLFHLSIVQRELSGTEISNVTTFLKSRFSIS